MKNGAAKRALASSTIDMYVKTCQVSLTKIGIPWDDVNSRETLDITAGGTLLWLHLQRPGLWLDI